MKLYSSDVLENDATRAEMKRLVEPTLSDIGKAKDRLTTILESDKNRPKPEGVRLWFSF